ncbi:MAG: histidine phosphatase family protein, partial [Thalassolituus sp.]
PALQERVMEAWAHLISEHPGKNVLVVSHGGVMRVLAQRLLELAPQAMNRLGIPYAGLMRFTIEQYDDGTHWVTLAGLDGEAL